MEDSNENIDAKKSPHVGEGPGRPKKDPGSKTQYTTKTIYFPSSVNYNIVWKEFENLCIRNSDSKVYNRNRYWKKGIVIRRLIMQYVLNNTKDVNVKDIVDEIIAREDKERIDKWEKDNK